MLERLDDYDWQEVFALAGEQEIEYRAEGTYGYSNGVSITVVPPGASGPSSDPFAREHVRAIEWIEDGQNDGPDWLVGGQLKDGRWFFIAAGCDYTGWDCQSGGNAYLADSRG